mmetsp:Transcript_132015/g.282344  ORF Transcript_132015/g.282344 Transcript_132015/m.282344 type:complete len:336 (+) Transcript_132015:1383-2390(+)
MLDGKAFIHGRATALTARAGHLQLLKDVLVLRILLRLLHHLVAEHLVCALDPVRNIFAKNVESAEDRGDARDHGPRVRQGQATPRNAFPLVGVLLGPQHIFHEVLLEPLIRQVNAKLLEGIFLELLETVDVENADVAPVGIVRRTSGARDLQLSIGLIDEFHRLLEEAFVEGLDKAVQNMARLQCCPWHLMEGVPARDLHLLALQDGAELGSLEAQKAGGFLNMIVIEDPVLLRLVILRERLSKVHQASQNLKEGMCARIVEADGLESPAEPMEIVLVPFLEAGNRLLSCQEAVMLCAQEPELFHVLVAEPGKHLIEAMVIPLPLAVHDHARALK